MIRDIRTGRAVTVVWFGNFYEPAYGDRTFAERETAALRDLGFTSIVLDAKDWEDLRERCHGGPASQYVESLEYLQTCAKNAGISCSFLLLYLNGDNLYPDIRFSPPIREGVTRADGTREDWYCYFSSGERARQTAHVREMISTYGTGEESALNACLLPDGRTIRPICSMWDPIAAADFSEEGIRRYRRFLQKRYGGEIQTLNLAYGSAYESFDVIPPKEYWFTERYPGETCFTREDVTAHPEKVRILSDNRRYLRFELRDYFRDMNRRIHEIDPTLYTVPDLAQWGYFLNVDGGMLTGVGMADLWDTAVRGIDLYELAPYVDSVNFLSVPVTPYGEPDPYVVCASHSMLRVMNRGREFLGGIFWGRFLYNDLYAVLTPEEIIGSIVCSGAGGYTSYGVCGMDDGGLLQRMGQPFLDSLQRGNAWMQEVLERTGARCPSKIAILFPTAMAACEAMQTEGNKERRMDLLGWYRKCLDLGYSADIIDRHTILEGGLAQYAALIIPADDCYGLERDERMEEKLEQWILGGGMLLHGPEPEPLLRRLGIHGKPCAGAPIVPKDPTRDVLLPQGPVFAAYAPGDHSRVLASFQGDAQHAAVMETRLGEGSALSFGFLYGDSLVSRIAPHVPRSEKNGARYPLPLSNENWVESALQRAAGKAAHPAVPGLEIADFANGTVFVSHSAYPIRTGDIEIPPRRSLFLAHDGTRMASWQADKSFEEEKR